jgi:hypothetical protein
MGSPWLNFDLKAERFLPPTLKQLRDAGMLDEMEK